MDETRRFNDTDRLLAAALELRPTEREGFLDRECAGDAELRSRVDRLLTLAETPTMGRPTGGELIETLAASSTERAADLTGQSLDRYRIVREIGRGGMGVVYEAWDEKLQRAVAVKVLPARAIDEQTRGRFVREARAAAALNHANIVAIHDAGEADDRPYLVMEYVPGRSLDEEAPRSLDEAIEIARLVCDALEHAHAQGVVHRDLKPANVLVAREGQDLLVKLTDMGIALTRGAARVTMSGAITGTPAYMAPEQALGHAVDGRTDLYSLGVMLYGWVTGRLPFEGDDALAVVSQHIHAPVVPPRTYRPDLPVGLEPLILKLLSKPAEERYPSAAEVRLALATVGTAQAAATRTQRVAIEGLTRGRMVGRGKDLARLQELWRAAAGGRSHLALISGEPGVGKTRLAQELTATARLDGALVLSGGCYENEATTPYLPFVEAFRRIVRERNDDELTEALGDTASEIARLAPEIEARLGPFPGRPKLSPQEERLHLFDHVARFLSRLAGPRCLLFFFDDLQWADHGSLALLHYLLRQLTEQSILFLGTYREVELDRAHALSKRLVDWNRERLATRVRLERLCRDDTARMIGTLLGQRDVAPEFEASLHRETEGNPFFVEEVLKALIAEGDLVREGAVWRRGSSDEFVLPQSVKAAIGSRLERVSAPCSDALRTAAVLGKVFDFAELAAVAGPSEDELLDALDEGAAAQLIVAGSGESFAFTHDKIREVLYEELNPIRRRRLHARVAGGLERLRESGKTVSVEDLAHHFVQGGDYEKGLLWADRAADAARRVFAHHEALEMLNRARECADALERTDELVRIDEALGDVARAAGDFTGSAEYYERALAFASSPTRRNAVRGSVGEVYVTIGDPRGREHVRRALEELDPEQQPQETAQAMMVDARYDHIDGNLESAAQKYRPAIRLAESLGNAKLLVNILAYLAGTLQHLSDFEESDAVAGRCIEIGEHEDVPLGVILGCEFRCENNFFRGRWDACLRYGEREEALARKYHVDERLGWSFFRSLALHPMGRLDEAEQLFNTAIEFCDRSGDRRLGLIMRMGLSACLLDSGRTEQAQDLAERALEQVDEAKLMAQRIAARECLGYVRLRQGRFDEAARVSLEAFDLWQSSGSAGAGLIYGAGLAEGLVSGGAVEQARKVLETHAEVARRTDARHRQMQNRRVQGLLEARQGRTSQALKAFDDAVVGFRACGGKIDLIRSLGDRARLLRELERFEEAAADLQRGRALANECGATPTVLEPSG